MAKHHPKLVKYIHHQISQGRDHNSIKKELLALGHDFDMVEASFEKALKNEKEFGIIAGIFFIVLIIAVFGVIVWFIGSSNTTDNTVSTSTLKVVTTTTILDPCLEYTNKREYRACLITHEYNEMYNEKDVRNKLGLIANINEESCVNVSKDLKELCYDFVNMASKGICEDIKNEFLRESCNGQKYYYKAVSENNITYCDNIILPIERYEKCIGVFK